MPDTRAPKVSITSQSQYKVLQYEISSMVLNKDYVNKATIYFEIKQSLSSIDIVQIDIPVSTINIHIINTFSSFLFYLKVMDRLDIY